MDTFTDEQRQAQRKTRDLVWRFHRDLKTYRQNPGKQRKTAQRARFDRLFTHKTGRGTKRAPAESTGPSATGRGELRQP